MAERPDRLVAHTPAEGSVEWHYLDDHLRSVAEMAAGFAAPFGGEGLAWWAGIYHDLGKAHPDFQDYLWANFKEPKKKHPTVDHKTAGAVKSGEIGGTSLQQVLHAHHGGLSDKGDVASKLRAYLQLESARLALALERFETLALIDADHTAAVHPPTPPAWLGSAGHALDMFMRMLFSALVDADALDTEAHWNRRESAARTVVWPSIADLEARFLVNQRALEERIRASDQADSPVNQIRREVYESCVGGAAQPPGFFRMTVPTGGGKTRSGLAFALRHAVTHGMRRVIVAVPFITITEQTADVYQQAVGADGLIEHHSGLETSGGPRDDPDGEASHDEMRRRLVSQNWDAPLIVTTTVQLFESLFTNRITKARKLHNLAGSVIILDEIQTLPPEMRGPILNVLHELVDHYGVSVVLSTATQPVLDTIAHDLETHGRDIVELAPDPPRLFATLRRVDYDLPCLHERWDWDRVADRMRAQPQAMSIVNTIKDAATLFAALDDPDALHLSTRMCGAHRRAVLKEIRRRLRDGEPCRVVSTQLVEAGVDLDFPMVLRALAPLDRIVQAAGRCNREGAMADLGQVVVFRSEEDSMPPGIYRQGADETLIMLRQAGLDLHHPSIFLDYFGRLYGLTDDDRRGIQAMRKALNFASVDEAFEMIRDDTFPVLVNYPDAVKDGDQASAWAAARDLLVNYQPKRGPSLRALLRDVQPWLVSCRLWERDRLLAQGTIQELVPDVLWEWSDTYDPQVGIKDTRLAPDGLLI